MVTAFKKTLTPQKPFNIFNIASGESYSVKEVIEIMKKITNINFGIEYINIDGSKNLVESVIIDISKAKNNLSWKPFYKLNDSVKIIFPKGNISYDNVFKTFFSRLNVLIDVFKILKLEKPDVVIPFSTNTNGSVIIISKILNIKVIASEHNNYKFRLKNPLIWLVKRLIYKIENTFKKEMEELNYL